MNLRTIIAGVAVSAAIAGCGQDVAESSVGAGGGTAAATPAAPAAGLVPDEMTEQRALADVAEVRVGRGDAGATHTVPRRLPAEERFLDGGSLSVSTVAKVMRSARFDEAIDAFGHDMATNVQAQDLGELYGRGIRRALRDGQLDGFACGTSLCIGAIRTSGPEAYAAWLDAFSSDRRVPTYSFVEALQVRGDHHEYRFLFSTDPAANSITDTGRR